MRSLFLFSLLISGALASTLGNVQHNSLVIYNDSLGLIEEQRSLSLDKGKSQIIYDDVASSIINNSVNLQLPSKTKISTQQYRFDKIDSVKLAQAHIGKEVEFYIKTGSDLMYKRGVLLSSNHKALVRSQGKIYTIASDQLIFSNIPKSLILKPSLIWNVDTQSAIKKDISLSYLVTGISWQSNYVLNLHKDTLDLNAWLEIDNRSGKAYKNTKLTLLAGDINREKPQHKEGRRAMAMADSPREIKASAHEGYQLYKVPFKVNLKESEKTQVQFIQKKNIKVKRSYEIKTTNPLYLRDEKKYKLDQFITLEKLDIPLPKGVVRIYSKSEGTQLLLGENSLGHTPKNEAIKLRLGKNFDLSVGEKLVQTRTDKYHNDNTVQYTLNNHSDTTKTIELQVPFTQNAKQLTQVLTDEVYKKSSANSIIFKITLKKGEEKKFLARYKGNRQ